MRISKTRLSIDFLILLVLMFVGYCYRAQIMRFINMERRYFVPCSVPIKYSIGQFDKEFGISRSEFLQNIEDGEKMWESAINRPLFEYSTSSPELTINLIYDYRQKATVKLQQLDQVISDGKNGPYKALNDKYNSMQASYLSDKNALDNMIARYKDDSAEYQRQVQYWNSRGGAPKNEYDKLEAMRQDLNSRNDVISQKTRDLNQLASDINTTVNDLNKMAKDLNLNIAKYNSISNSTGETFDEGRYISDSEGQRINIYQFENGTKLVRVLTHELGHAIGLDHVDNPKAIMYKLNQGDNENLTTDDIAALNNLCHNSDK